MYASYDPEFCTLCLITLNGTAIVTMSESNARIIVRALGLPFVRSKWDDRVS